MRSLVLIISIGLALSIASAFIRIHTVSVGVFMSPREPSVSVFIPAPGFPLPIYATNDLPQFPPAATIVFWRNLPWNFAFWVVVAGLCAGVARIVRYAGSRKTKA